MSKLKQIKQIREKNEYYFKRLNFQLLMEIWFQLLFALLLLVLNVSKSN